MKSQTLPAVSLGLPVNKVYHKLLYLLKINHYEKVIYLLFFLVSSAYSQTSDALKLCVALQDNFTSNYEANNAVDKILSVISISQKPILQPYRLQ